MSHLARFEERTLRREPLVPTGAAAAPDPPVKKGKSKIRSAWISFASRILAQLIGAVATIGLGVVVMQHYAPARTPVPVAGGADRPASAAPAPSRGIAVLPVANFTGDPARDALADSLTGAVIVALTSDSGPPVVSRTSSMRYKNTTKSLPEIARELGVTLVVESSLSGQGERMRVTTQLIDGATDLHVWAKSFDVAGRDLLAVQADVAAAVAEAIKASVPR